MNRTLKLVLLLLIVTNNSFKVIANDESKVVTSFYSQSVYLDKYDDTITQSVFRLNLVKENIDYYLGVYFDNDNQSDKKVTYTDKQVSPLIGIQSKMFFPTFPMRFFGEYRDVNRIGNFPDNRADQTNELRIGTLGYNFKRFTSFFNEYYFAVFYSQLYDQKILAQGWDKTGFRFGEKTWYFDVYNEFLGDSFDLSKQEQTTADLRPGLRLMGINSLGSLQLLLQHVIPIDQSGRPNETRATLVLYLQN